MKAKLHVSKQPMTHLINQKENKEIKKTTWRQMKMKTQQSKMYEMQQKQF